MLLYQCSCLNLGARVQQEKTFFITLLHNFFITRQANYDITSKQKLFNTRIKCK